MRKKITHIKLADFELAVAAAGDGPTINTFIARLKRNGKTVSPSSLEQVSAWLRGELKATFKEQRIRPKRVNSSIRLTVGAWHNVGTSALWTQRVARLLK